MAVYAMLVTRIVDDPLPCAEAVEQESRLLEGEVVRVAPWHIQVLFDANDVRVVVSVLRLERGGIPAVPGVVLLDVGNELASVRNRTISAPPRRRSGERQLGPEGERGQEHEIERCWTKPSFIP